MASAAMITRQTDVGKGQAYFQQSGLREKLAVLFLMERWMGKYTMLILNNFFFQRLKLAIWL